LHVLASGFNFFRKTAGGWLTFAALLPRHVEREIDYELVLHAVQVLISSTSITYYVSYCNILVHRISRAGEKLEDWNEIGEPAAIPHMLLDLHKFDQHCMKIVP
jgi:hypothetical protein